MVAILQRKFKNGLLRSAYVSKPKEAEGLIREFMGLVFFQSVEDKKFSRNQKTKIRNSTLSKY